MEGRRRGKREKRPPKFHFVSSNLICRTYPRQSLFHNPQILVLHPSILHLIPYPISSYPLSLASPPHSPLHSHPISYPHPILSSILIFFVSYPTPPPSYPSTSVAPTFIPSFSYPQPSVLRPIPSYLISTALNPHLPLPILRPISYPQPLTLISLSPSSALSLPIRFLSPWATDDVTRACIPASGYGSKGKIPTWINDFLSDSEQASDAAAERPRELTRMDEKGRERTRMYEKGSKNERE